MSIVSAHRSSQHSPSMASLNLSSTGEPESGADSEPGPSSPASPLSRSLSPASPHLHSISDSPSIVVSEPDRSHPSRSPRLGGPRSLGRANRFSPYLGAASNVRIICALFANRRSFLALLFSQFLTFSRTGSYSKK